MNLRHFIEQFCGVSLTADDTSACPFAGRLHDTDTGERAVKWTFPEDGGKPHARCFHAKCQDAWNELIKDLYRAINAERARERGERAAEHPATGTPSGGQSALARRPLPAAPKAQPPRAAKCDLARAAQLAERCPVGDVTPDLLRRISPVEIPADPAAHGALLIDTLYRQGEHVLVFTTFASQGQFLHTAGTQDFFRLGGQPGIKARRSPRLPITGREGVWYLTAPVVGTWQPNPHKHTATGGQALGRRHTACCTRFPYLVLESDEVPPEQWLRILAQLRERIAAIYSSGGKSIHTLIRVDANTPEEFNLHRSRFLQRLTLVGADPAAITPVRLSRLPGCTRQGVTKNGVYTPYEQPRMQELYYLAPEPSDTPLAEKIQAANLQAANLQSTNLQSTK
ncbi:MAG: hypothetical protein IJA81_09085 [Akkermansia sp.]|nr:hypothetical protein [Akkermansia sp.]